jgi:transcriptional regulator with XRE-family HTH domain
MGTHLGKEVRGRMLELLDEATLPFRLSRKAGEVDGWLRAVRLAVGITVEELACRQGVQQREIFRLERAERESRITLAALRRAAGAMDCELTYALTPRRGTLGEMAAARKVVRENALKAKRLNADEQREMDGKPRRIKDPRLAALKNLLVLAGIEV